MKLLTFCSSAILFFALCSAFRKRDETPAVNQAGVGSFFKGLLTKIKELVSGTDDDDRPGCPPGWSPGPAGSSSCYYVPESPQTDHFHGQGFANEICGRLLDGAELVSIESADEQEFIEQLLAEKGDSEWDFWTSGREGSDRKYHWAGRSKTLAEEGFVNWFPGQPDGGWEKCLFIGHKSSYDHKWHDHRCNYRCSYICEFNASRPATEKTTTTERTTKTTTTATTATTTTTTTTTTTEEPSTSECKNGFVRGPHNQCFRLFHDRETFASAEKTCESHDAILAEMHDRETYDFIQNQLSQLPVVPRLTDWRQAFFVGATDLKEEGEFRWNSGEGRIDLGSEWWGEGEPNNYLVQEDCVDVFFGGLNDFPCNHRLRFICQRPFQKPVDANCPANYVYGPQGKCYGFKLDRVVFSIARDSCRLEGGSLAVISDQKDYDFIQRELGMMLPRPSRLRWNEGFFVGAFKTDEGFQWIDESTLYEDSDWWGPNEPNNYLGKERCVDVYHGGINDFSCNNPLRYICQIPGRDTGLYFPSDVPNDDYEDDDEDWDGVVGSGGGSGVGEIFYWG